MAVSTGQMNQCLTIQRKTIAADDTGQPQETWTNVGNWIAAVEALTTREVFQARQAEVVVSHKITGWYRKDLHENAPLWRLLYGERILNIASAVEVENRRKLELMCSEVQPWQNQE